jgi:hypothetical protein
MTAYGTPVFPLDGPSTRLSSIRLLGNAPILTPFSSVCQVLSSSIASRSGDFGKRFLKFRPFRFVFTSLERQLDGQLRGASFICGKSWMCLETALRAALEHQSKGIEVSEVVATKRH